MSNIYGTQPNEPSIWEVIFLSKKVKYVGRFAKSFDALNNLISKKTSIQYKSNLNGMEEFCNSPSRSSREAPPPVETWLTLSSVPHLAQQVAVSPPPMMVVASPVLATTASINFLVPLANFSNSNTPGGLTKLKRMLVE